MLIVGAGPAGLAAALTAARSGAAVMLVDEQAEMGGSLLSETGMTIDGNPAWDWLAAAKARACGHGERHAPDPPPPPSATTIRTLVGLCQRLTDHMEKPPAGAPRERLWRVRARQVVLAQGAIEKPLVFDRNDRPGVMLAGAAQTYLNRYGVKIGNRAVVATTHDSAWFATFDLAEGGVEVAAIVDLRADVKDGLVEKARFPRHRGPDRLDRDWHVRAATGQQRSGQSGRRRPGRHPARDLLRLSS